MVGGGGEDDESGGGNGAAIDTAGCAFLKRGAQGLSMEGCIIEGSIAGGFECSVVEGFIGESSIVEGCIVDDGVGRGGEKFPRPISSTLESPNAPVPEANPNATTNAIATIRITTHSSALTRELMLLK